MKRSIVFGLLLSSPFLSAGALLAASVPAEMVVTVDCKGEKDCPVLHQEDVMVYQENQRHKVTDFKPLQSPSSNLQLVLLFDDSAGSYFGTQMPDFRKFVETLPPNAEIAIGYMRNGAPNLVEKFTRDHEAAAKAIRLPIGEAGGNGSPYFALSDLVKHWPSDEHADRREVLMVTDGIDRYYTEYTLDDPYVAAAISDSQKAGVLVYSIYLRDKGGLDRRGLATNIGQSYLNEVAEQTGGKTYWEGFGNPVSVTPFLDDFREQLANQYKIGFLADSEKGNALEPVKLTTEIPRAKISAASKVATASQK